jgi:hypothetical protein
MSEPNPGRTAALLGEAEAALRVLTKACLTVAPTLKKPYSDDPDTSPWEQFVGHRARAAYDCAQQIAAHLKTQGQPGADTLMLLQAPTGCDPEDRQCPEYWTGYGTPDERDSGITRCSHVTDDVWTEERLMGLLRSVALVHGRAAAAVRTGQDMASQLTPEEIAGELAPHLKASPNGEMEYSSDH